MTAFHQTFGEGGHCHGHHGAVLTVGLAILPIALYSRITPAKPLNSLTSGDTKSGGTLLDEASWTRYWIAIIPAMRRMNVSRVLWRAMPSQKPRGIPQSGDSLAELQI
ncbi:hypothetical protein KCP74_21350 [Salmonella enterica subsp. enterica]|nr:hypothetical protein KCP74_21350 [Salmonella enterica subsp. enterica]